MCVCFFFKIFVFFDICTQHHGNTATKRTEHPAAIKQVINVIYTIKSIVVCNLLITISNGGR